MKTSKEQVVSYLRKCQEFQMNFVLSENIHIHVSTMANGFQVGVYIYGEDFKIKYTGCFGFSTLYSPRINEAAFLDLTDIINENR